MGRGGPRPLSSPVPPSGSAERPKSPIRWAEVGWERRAGVWSQPSRTPSPCLSGPLPATRVSSTEAKPQHRHPPCSHSTGIEARGEQGRAAGPRGPRGSAGFPLAPLLQGSLQSPRRAHLSCLLGLRSLAVLSLAWSFTTLMLLESAGCCLVECASVRVCLMVWSGKAEVPLCPLRAARQGHAVPSCPLTARLTSAAWLGGVRQGPPL